MVSERALKTLLNPAVGITLEIEIGIGRLDRLGNENQTLVVPAEVPLFPYLDVAQDLESKMAFGLGLPMERSTKLYAKNKMSGFLLDLLSLSKRDFIHVLQKQTKEKKNVFSLIFFNQKNNRWFGHLLSCGATIWVTGFMGSASSFRHSSDSLF